MKKWLSVTMVFLLIGLTMALFFTNNFHPKNRLSQNSNIFEIKAKVLEVDDDDVMKGGLANIGFQRLKIELLEGSFKGNIIMATNNLLGQLEIDEIYEVGDIIIAGIQIKNNEITNAIAVSLYRQGNELLLFGLFLFLLIFFARYIGLKAFLSFIASLYIIWNFLLPGLLKGYNPMLISASFLILLTFIIIFAIAGFTKKGLSAFIGTLCGLFVTIGITYFFGSRFGLMGMTASYASTLAFSGYLHLNMRDIFYAAIIIGASGAAMDIAMDVAASMQEVKEKKPEITITELIQSGFNVGRAVIGTMTTTLLLAYSGGYLTLLMFFVSKDTSFVRILNLKIVAAEIMRTLIGSIGLVLVAPITAIVAGWILSTHFDLNRIKKLFKMNNEHFFIE